VPGLAITHRSSESLRRLPLRQRCVNARPGTRDPAKLLASEASWAAANACLDTHGGFGFAEEYDVERKFRETRLYTVAPVSNNLVLAFIGQNVLGMPRSY
jgi:acyl-CoA dehydrogenase